MTYSFNRSNTRRDFFGYSVDMVAPSPPPPPSTLSETMRSESVVSVSSGTIFKHFAGKFHFNFLKAGSH